MSTNGKCVLLIGSNLGDRLQNLESAKVHIEKAIGSIRTRSQIYESEPWGDLDQGPFLNQILTLDTKEHPIDVLETCLNIETLMGRKRIKKWSSRLIDIDILYFEDLIMDEEKLTIPHPEIQNRRFTLIPLVELDPEYLHPLFKKTNRELLESCSDFSNVNVYYDSINQ